MMSRFTFDIYITILYQIICKKGFFMRISTKGRYALRVMIDLASFGNGSFIALKDISQRQNIPIKYLEQIVSTLNKAGYLTSMRGSNGGYRLSKSPEEYNVGTVLRTVEGTLTPVECVAYENGVTLDGILHVQAARSGRHS